MNISLVVRPFDGIGYMVYVYVDSDILIERREDTLATAEAFVRGVYATMGQMHGMENLSIRSATYASKDQEPIDLWSGTRCDT